MKKYKFSKAYVAVFMYRFAFLLFVPFLQALIFANSGIAKLFTLYSADIAVAVLLTVIAVVRAQSGNILAGKKKLSVNIGVMIKRQDISFSERHSLTLTQALMLRFLKAGKLRISSGLSTATVYLKKQDALSFFELNPDKKQKQFISPLLRTLLMSAVFSNSLTGLLAAVPFLRKGASLLGAHQSALILQGVSLEGWLSLRGLPPLLSKISSILLTCWAVGFFTEFFREYGLRFIVSEDTLIIKKGLVTKTYVRFGTSNIRALVARQSVLLFACGLYSLQVGVNLNPSSKIHILSAATRLKCADVEDELFGKPNAPAKIFAPPKKALWSYTWLPLMLFLLCSLSLIFLPERFIIKVIFGVAASISVLMYLFRIVAFHRSHIKISGKTCEVKFYSKMNFIRTIFYSRHINSAKLSQNPFQRFNHRCNLTLTLNLAKPFRIKIKHLKLRDAQKATEMLT